MLAFVNRTRAAVELERRRGDVTTYSSPLDRTGAGPEMREFLTDFYRNVLYQQREQMMGELATHPKTVGKYYAELVPAKVTNDDFWLRYYYRCGSLERIQAELEATDADKRRQRNASLTAALNASVQTLVASVTTSNSHQEHDRRKEDVIFASRSGEGGEDDPVLIDFDKFALQSPTTESDSTELTDEEKHDTATKAAPTGNLLPNILKAANTATNTSISTVVKSEKTSMVTHGLNREATLHGLFPEKQMQEQWPLNKQRGDITQEKSRPDEETSVAESEDITVSTLDDGTVTSAKKKRKRKKKTKKKKKKNHAPETLEKETDISVSSVEVANGGDDAARDKSTNSPKESAIVEKMNEPKEDSALDAAIFGKHAEDEIEQQSELNFEADSAMNSTIAPADEIAEAPLTPVFTDSENKDMKLANALVETLTFECDALPDKEMEAGTLALEEPSAATTDVEVAMETVPPQGDDEEPTTSDSPAEITPGDAESAIETVPPYGEEDEATTADLPVDKAIGGAAEAIETNPPQGEGEEATRADSPSDARSGDDKTQHPEAAPSLDTTTNKPVRQSKTQVETEAATISEAWESKPTTKEVQKQQPATRAKRENKLQQMLGIFFAALLFIVVALLLVADPSWASSLGDHLCSPLPPNMHLNVNATSGGANVRGVAPWWVPESYKRYVFQRVCGPDRVQTMISWAPQSKKGPNHILTIMDLNSRAKKPLVVKKGAHQARLSPTSLEVTLKSGKTEVIQAPWAKSTLTAAK